MATTDKEQQALRALDQIEQLGRQAADERLAQPEADALDLGQIVGEVCRQYSRVKPFLEAALWLVERIPVYGKQIASAIRLLMGLLDRICSLA